MAKPRVASLSTEFLNTNINKIQTAKTDNVMEDILWYLIGGAALVVALLMCGTNAAVRFKRQTVVRHGIQSNHGVQALKPFPPGAARRAKRGLFRATVQNDYASQAGVNGVSGVATTQFSNESQPVAGEIVRVDDGDREFSKAAHDVYPLAPISSLPGESAAGSLPIRITTRGLTTGQGRKKGVLQRLGTMFTVQFKNQPAIAGESGEEDYAEG